MLGERVEIPIAMQQFPAAHNAPGGDDGIDCLANAHSQAAKCAKVFCSLNCDLLATEFYYRQGRQHLARMFEIPCPIESLQPLRQDQVPNPQRFATQQLVEFLGLRCDRTSEVVDPYTGINENQRSVLIAAKSPAKPAS